VSAARLTIVTALATLGCAAGRQLYPGATLPPDRVALVAESSEVSVERIDGKRVRGSEWEILPGDHRLAVETLASANVNVPEFGQSGRIVVRARCEIEFRADAGRRYAPMRSGGLRGTEPESAEGDLRIWLEDERGGRAAEKAQRCEPSVLGISHPLPKPRRR
jgi:hypothetical protein